MLQTALRLGLLMLSYFGYWEFFRKRWQIHVCFLPAFTFGVHFTLLFLPGLLNLLLEASVVIYVTGLILFVQAFWKDRFRLLQPYWNWGYLFLLAAMALIAVMVKGKVLTWFDCFTHWGTVVRNMLIADRFPTFDQPAVGFTSYPLGTSTILYYFCRMTSVEEDIQMLAQNLLTLSMLLPVFSCVKSLGAVCTVFVALLANYLLSCCIPITELLVDEVLPLTAVATVLFLFRECLNHPQADQRRLYLLFPLLFLLMNIKNSSMFFLLLIFLLMFAAIKRQGKSVKPALWMALALAVGSLLWDRHCDYVFVNAEMAQHSVNVTYLSSRLAEKSLADIVEISRRCLVFSFTRPEMPWLLLWLVLPGVAAWIAAPELKKAYCKLAAFSAVLYAAYVVGLMGMFVFSMHRDGALRLESIERYLYSIDTVLYVLIGVFFFAVLAQSRGGKRWLSAVLMLVPILGTWIFPGKMCNVIQLPYDPSKRMAIQTMLEEYGVAHGFSYLICDTDTVPLTSEFICRFFVESDRVKQIQVTEPSHMEAEAQYDYILILDQGNPVIESYLQEHYPDQAGQQVIQCFK